MTENEELEFNDELDDLEVDDEMSSGDGEMEEREGEDGNLYEHWRFTADPKQRLMRIDKYVADRVPHASRTKIQMAADAGNIQVNGKPVKSNYKVRPADVVTVFMTYPRRDVEIVPENIPLDIVYEDDTLLVINKPAGMVVHPGHGNFTGTMVNALAYYLKTLPMFANVNDPRPGLVHRIDKDTSGLLVVAKNDYAKMHLAKQFHDKTTQRQYVALVWGIMEQEHGTVRGNIGRCVQDRLRMDVFPEGSEIGKHAVTHYDMVEALQYISLIHCHLETGRTHQIRAHMKHIGHPLFSDERYGGNVILKGQPTASYKAFVENCFKILPRQALHAQTLGFVHPKTGEMMQFTSELPQDMVQCIEKWRTYAKSSAMRQ
ncbi:MAG: RluA family pseudouridine synthase [Bacteroidales bacterium]|nr:RluA family pseudouridine synthase [Bacteroidales bacterium]